jgi:hypothetical protein
LKRFMSFFKHADLRRPNPTTEIDFDPALSELFFVACTLGVERLGGRLTDVESGFMFWCQIHRPDLLNGDGGKIINDSFNVDSLQSLRGLEKEELLAQYLDSRARRRALGLD